MKHFKHTIHLSIFKNSAPLSAVAVQATMFILTQISYYFLINKYLYNDTSLVKSKNGVFIS
jgi:hypothetical protein